MQLCVPTSQLSHLRPRGERPCTCDVNCRIPAVPSLRLPFPPLPLLSASQHWLWDNLFTSLLRAGSVVKHKYVWRVCVCVCVCVCMRGSSRSGLGDWLIYQSCTAFEVRQNGYGRMATAEWLWQNGYATQALCTDCSSPRRFCGRE